MFLIATGGLLTYAAPQIALKVLLGAATICVALYILSRSYDCILDAQGRVAAITGSATRLGFRSRGVRIGEDDHMGQIVIASRRFSVPDWAEEMVSAGEITLYFVPRSRIVVNVDRASSDLVGGTGHYLNSQPDLRGSVLDFIRSYRDQLDHA
jgi:hypothetical protein